MLFHVLCCVYECPERQFVCRLFCDFRFGPIVRKLGSTSLWPRLGRWRHGSGISGEEVKGLHGGGVVLPNNTSQVPLTRTQERSESKRSVRSTSTSQQEQPNDGCPASDRVRKNFASRGHASFKKGHSHQSYDGCQENGAKCLRHRSAAVSTTTNVAMQALPEPARPEIQYVPMEVRQTRMTNAPL